MVGTIYIVKKTDNTLVWKYKSSLDRSALILGYNLDPADIPSLPAGVIYYTPTMLYVSFDPTYHTFLWDDEVTVQWRYDNGLITWQKYLEDKFYTESLGPIPESIFTYKITLDGVEKDIVMFRKFAVGGEFIPSRYIITDIIPVDKTPLMVGDILWNVTGVGTWLYAVRITNGFRLVKFDETISD